MVAEGFINDVQSSDAINTVMDIKPLLEELRDRAIEELDIPINRAASAKPA